MKHFTPLESSPEIFTALAHSLGLDSDILFEDVLELAPSQLPDPTFALILIFPTSGPYEATKLKEDGELQPSSDKGIVWAKQTINNACGLYAIIHAICNGGAKQFIRADSWLAMLLEISMSEDRDQAMAQYMEGSSDLERLYGLAARQGDTEPPEDPAAEVDFHYVCFAKSASGLGVFELDGDRVGPVLRGFLPWNGPSVAHEDVIGIIREFIEQTGCSTMCSLMSLGRRR